LLKALFSNARVGYGKAVTEQEEIRVRPAPAKKFAASSGRGRLWRYGPLALWLGFIFYASTGAMSASETSRVIGPLLRWLFPDISAASLAHAHFITRKLAHFAEYALLALLAARAFTTSSYATLRRVWFAASLLLAIAYSLFDEYHQSLVPSRTGTIWDSLIDSAGGLTALLILAQWRTRSRAGKETG